VTRAQLAVAVVAAALTLTAGASCTAGPGGPSPSPTPSSASWTPKPTPSVTPSTSATPRPGEAEVIALVEQYYVVNNKIRLDKSIPVSRYRLVVTGSWGQTLQKSVKASRLRGERAEGRSLISGRPVVSRLTPPNHPMEARAVVCLDVRAAKLYNRDGKSLVPKNRPDFYVETLTLARTDDRWLVTDAANKGARKC